MAYIARQELILAKMRHAGIVLPGDAELRRRYHGHLRPGPDTWSWTVTDAEGNFLGVASPWTMDTMIKVRAIEQREVDGVTVVEPSEGDKKRLARYGITR